MNLKEKRWLQGKGWRDDGKGENDISFYLN